MTIQIQQETPFSELKIQIRSVRFKASFNFNVPCTYLVLGKRFSGKSAVLEVVATKYKKIFDLYGSGGETLAWCKPEYIEYFKKMCGREPRILLVHGKGVNIIAKWDKLPFDELSLKTFEQYDVITTTHKFYHSEELYFKALDTITHILWNERYYYTEPWFVLIREAANWLYARMRIVKDDRRAKADFIKTLRGAYHAGLAVGVDTIRWTNIDKEVRDESDYIFIKKVGNIGLPDDLRYVYRYANPYRLMQLKPEVFWLIADEAIAFGKTDYPPWHRERKENIFAKTNIEIMMTDHFVPEDRLTCAMSDFEHSEIINLYDQRLSMQKIAAQLQRSPATINSNIKIHNNQVATNQKCQHCINASNPLASKLMLPLKNVRRLNT